MKNTKICILILSFTITILIFFSEQSFAVHKGAGDLTCGNCHTMHNSQGGGSNTLGGVSGGSLVMLRADVSNRENIHKLCLQCHSTQGAQATTAHSPHGQTAPKVHIPAGTWTQDTHLSQVGAGGNFYPELNTDFSLSTEGNNIALGKGHSVGLTNVTPPGGDTAIVGFSCTSCHDPHGTSSTTDTSVNKFRNLRKSATNAGNNAGVTLTATEFTSWVGGVTGLHASGGNYSGVTADGANVWAIFNGTPTGIAATDSANSNSYGGGSSGGVSRWCAQCHDNWHENLASSNLDSNGQDWHRHPVDNLLQDATPTSGAGVTIIDTSNYNVTTAGQYLPVASGAANRVFYRTDNTTDKVMCLSCHFAHGGPYNDNLRWNYTSAVGSGSQNGNSIPTTRGCQLCHNR
jgi:hypothetical protein